MLLIFVLFPLLFSFIALNYLKTDDFEIKTTIGVVDADQSGFSKNVIERLRRDKSLMVLIFDENSGHEALIKEDIIGLYIIKEGFFETIKKGNTQRIIEVRYLADNYTAPGITDMITPHFLLDILKEQTMLIVNKAEFSGNAEMGEKFSELFLDYTTTYEDSEELELQIILNSIDSKATKPLFNTSKEIIIRYFLSVILIFMIITGFYQAFQVNVDREHGIIGRIKLSKCGYYQYVLGNVVGIAGIVFIISVLQMLLLKNMLFYQLNMAKLVVGLAIYSLSISLLSLAIMLVLKKGSDFQLAIPYLMIIIWILGGWIYSETIINSGMLQYMGLIPGMMIKDDLINQFTDVGQNIRCESIMMEMGFQIFLFCFIYLKGKSGYNKNVN